MEDKIRLVKNKNVKDMKGFIGFMNTKLSILAHQLEGESITLREYDRHIDEWIELEEQYNMKFNGGR